MDTFFVSAIHVLDHHELPRTRGIKSWILFLLSIFLFRTYYGLSMDFWNDDERQIYLLGLSWFTTGQWPYFGPDVIHTNQQIAGALQALLVGLPFHMLPIPEAPLIFLNILSFSGLYLLATYLTRIAPKIPKTIIFLWLFTLPWTLNISAHVYNPSYLLCASCVFFVACAETVPSLNVGLMGRRTAFFAQGFAIAWCSQLHLSWPLLVPFSVAAIMGALRRRELTFIDSTLFSLGALIPSLLLIPTLIKFGVQPLIAPFLANSGVNEGNAGKLLVIVARFFSFGAYEVPRFITAAIDGRWTYLIEHPWLLPFAALLCVFGLLQPLLALTTLVRHHVPPLFRWILALTLVVLYFAFLTSSRPPTARNYYILLPIAVLAMAYSCAEFNWSIKGGHVRRWAQLIIATAVIYQGLLALIHLEEQSLYRDRLQVSQALILHNYRILGERRKIVLPAVVR